MRLSRPKRAFSALAPLLLLVGALGAAGRRPPCSGGTFVFPDGGITFFGGALGPIDAITLAPGGAIQLGTCSLTEATTAGRRHASTVRARWSSCGASRKIQLVARIQAPSCNVFRGRIRAKGEPWQTFQAILVPTTTTTTTTTSTTSTTTISFAGCGTFLKAWGHSGHAAGEFDGPAQVAIDEQGDVYATDFYNNRIQKFSEDGDFLATWGTEGAGNGQFDNPYGIVADGRGHVYVSDIGNDRIQEFTLSGTFVTAWGSAGSGVGQFHQPTGVATDGDGNLYVGDFYNGRVQKFDANGTFVAGWSCWLPGAQLQFCHPAGVAADRRGNVYVTDLVHHTVAKFDTNGVSLDGGGYFSTAWGIAVDDSGDLFVSDFDSDSVQVLDPMFRSVAEWGEPGSADGAFVNPRGVALDLDRHVYVADHGNDRIQKFACP